MTYSVRNNVPEADSNLCKSCVWQKLLPKGKCGGVAEKGPHIIPERKVKKCGGVAEKRQHITPERKVKKLSEKRVAWPNIDMATLECE